MRVLIRQSFDADHEWRIWRENVIAIIRTKYHDLFPYLQHSEIDWDAWKPLYEQGHTPQTAVASGLSTTDMDAVIVVNNDA